ncbi:hypothetical protein JQ612_10805 [Bradyrhizobium manausense]|uniref:hypothetical protein n=1 Tax=Bradyrhizobium manausense TaxID=989370 RepID=UPI001BA6C11B|nr:hypothetical protein [Bradyrhizobium manausense]MBR0833684.1 hypothetical protein [Bradyrhizobium manausense]
MPIAASLPRRDLRSDGKMLKAMSATSAVKKALRQSKPGSSDIDSKAQRVVSNADRMIPASSGPK